MKPEIVEVVNFRAFGEKVKAWARGTDALPQTIDEFAAQLADGRHRRQDPRRASST